MLHIEWESTVDSHMSGYYGGASIRQPHHMPHILGPIAVSFIEYDDLLVKDATKLEPIFDEQLEAEDLCHGTK